MSNSENNFYYKIFGRLFDKVHPEIWGFVASGIPLVCILLSRIGYVGKAGEAYSFLNHYISELGQVGVSHLAPLCNTGLILGGFISVVFVVGLGMYIGNTTAKIAMRVGVFSGIACSLVGFFPMNTPHHIHTIVATSFFVSGMLMVAIFSVAIVRQKGAKIPKSFSLAGLVVVGVFIAFLVDAFVMGYRLGHGPLGVISTRPNIWWRTILEWSMFFAIVGWILLISACMHVVNRKSNERMRRIQS